MQKWEYLTIKFSGTSKNGKIVPVIDDPEFITNQINWYAQQGWELVTQYPTAGTGAYSYGRTVAIFATFKRRMEEQA